MGARSLQRLFDRKVRDILVDHLFTEDVPASVSSPYRRPTHFNAHYLLSALAPVESIDISLWHPTKAVRFDGEGWWHAAVMPVKV